MEIDWEDGVLPGLVDACGDSDVLVPVPDPTARDVARSSVGQSGPLARVKIRAAATSRWKFKLPPPGRRTREEACLAAARMRDAKARKRTHAVSVKGAKKTV